MGGRAQHLPSRGHALRVEQLGDAKVSELYLLFELFTGSAPVRHVAQQHVFRLHVTVYHAQPVGVIERDRKLDTDRGGDLGR